MADPAPTPWSNARLYDRSASRADELAAIVADLQDALLPENLQRAAHGGTPDWARKGLSLTEPGKTAFVQPSLYSNWQYQDVLANQLRSASHEQAIAEAAAELYRPYVPPVPKPGTPPYKPRTPGAKPARISSGASPWLLMLDLLTHAPEVNKGEQEALDKINGPRRKLKAEPNMPNDATLQQFFQFMGQ